MVSPSVWGMPAVAALHRRKAEVSATFDGAVTGFCSIEADVYVINNTLVIGHDIEDLNSSVTLQAGTPALPSCPPDPLPSLNPHRDPIAMLTFTLTMLFLTPTFSGCRDSDPIPNPPPTLQRTPTLA